MSATVADINAPLVQVVNGHRPAQDVLDYAYDLWAWKHKQSSAAVAKELDIEPRTVQRWCRDENWRTRYEEERAEQSPTMARYATALILGSSAPKAALRLDAMLEGHVPFDKTEAYVCQVILDRTGFAPVNLRDQDPSKKPHDGSVRVSTEELSDDALASKRDAIATGRQARA